MKKPSKPKPMSVSHHRIKIHIEAITSVFLEFDFSNAFVTGVKSDQFES